MPGSNRAAGAGFCGVGAAEGANPAETAEFDEVTSGLFDRLSTAGFLQYGAPGDIRCPSVSGRKAESPRGSPQ
jgi:hypothetical protein